MDKKGFTILEVIMALGLFSLIILTILSISMKTDEKPLLEQRVYKLASDITYAKEYARTNNMGLDFVIDEVNRMYYVRRGNFELLREELPKDYTIHCTLSTNQIYINNLGRIRANSSIRINNKHGHVGTIFMSVETGRVRVEFND